jgi:hypothetical protein
MSFNKFDEPSIFTQTTKIAKTSTTTMQRKYGPLPKKKTHSEMTYDGSDDDSDEPSPKQMKIEHSSSDNEEEETPKLTDEQKAIIMRQQMGLPPLVNQQVSKDAIHHYTQQEIRSLKETESLFQSSLFRIAVCIYLVSIE